MENKVIEKKVGYDFESKDFVIDQELTVTITLGEYRELIAIKATKESAIRQAEADRYKRNEENKRLTEENAELKAELYELKKSLDEKAENGKVSVDYEDGGEC